MELPAPVKRFISRFTSSPIEAGVGFSNDETIILPVGTAKQDLDKKVKSQTPRYILKNNLNGFDLVGLVKSGENTLYQLKSCETGETFNISRKLLDFLFKKVEQSE